MFWNLIWALLTPRRLHGLPDRMGYEPGISPDTLHLLTQMGHSLEQEARILGSTQSIHKGVNGATMGASDTRRDGAGAVPQR
jgi:gamma-glutamyltranspeptidase